MACFFKSKSLSFFGPQVGCLRRSCKMSFSTALSVK